MQQDNPGQFDSIMGASAPEETVQPQMEEIIIVEQPVQAEEPAC